MSTIETPTNRDAGRTPPPRRGGIAGWLRWPWSRPGFRDVTRSASPSFDLDTIVLEWLPGVRFSARDLVAGGVLLLGRSGSGKTSSSGHLLGRRVVGLPTSGGLIIAAKSEDREMWSRVFARAGRSQDLLVFGPNEPPRFNMLDYARQLSDDPRNIVHCLQTLAESLRGFENRPGTDQEQFWQLQNERALYAAVVIVRLAHGGKVSAPDLQTFISEAAMSPEQISDAKWVAGTHSQWLDAAHRAPKSEIEQHDFDLAVEYWLGAYPSMAEKTRSCVVAGVMGLLHVFNTGMVRQLASGNTTVTPDDTLAGRWVLVDMSPAEWGVAGNLICAGWKYLTQRAVLKRRNCAGAGVHTIWADEAHLHVNSFDATYLAQCRSRRGCMVMLTQSLPGLYAAMSEGSGEHQTHSLLSNFGHVVVHAVDPVSAEWAVKKLGRQRETFLGGSVHPDTDAYDELFGTPRVTGSYSEHYEPVLQDGVFMNGLRTGGPKNGFVCDAIVIRSGEPFSSGANWLRCAFRQET
jgi:hypothetical protein